MLAIAVDPDAVLADGRNDIDHWLLVGRNVVGLVHVESIHRLLPWGEQTLMVERSHLVDGTQSFLGLPAPRIVVALQCPEELSADAVFHALGE